LIQYQQVGSMESNRMKRFGNIVTNHLLGGPKSRGQRTMIGLSRPLFDCCLYKDFVKWPDPDERGVIADRIRADFGLPNCIGIADGTLLSLAFRPPIVASEMKVPWPLARLYIIIQRCNQLMCIISESIWKVVRAWYKA
jgi:hypothetical protein